MKSACGCTLQGPALTCILGGELFAECALAEHALKVQVEGDKATLWKRYQNARLAYRNHAEGWREGDMRLKRGTEGWMIEMRLGEQWVFQFGSADGVSIRAWFKDRGYWRYAQIDGDEPQDRLTGYYRKRTSVWQPGPEMDLKTHIAILITTIIARRFSGSLTQAERLSVQHRAAALLASYGIHPLGSSDLHTIEAFIDEALRVREALDAAPAEWLL